MNESLIGLHSQPTGVVVVVAKGYSTRDKIDAVASSLESLGLQNTEVMSGVGAIVGTVADELAISKMAKVEGVQKISKSRLARRGEWSPRG